MHHVILPDADATQRFGECLGGLLQPGTMIALEGDLGAGKTSLAKGIGAGLGIRRVIRSPTFVLVNQYDDGRLPLFHADLYRLGDPEELELLGLEEVLDTGVLLLEWASQFPEVLSEDVLVIAIEDHGDGRVAQLRAHQGAGRALADAVVEAWRG